MTIHINKDLNKHPVKNTIKSDPCVVAVRKMIRHLATTPGADQTSLTTFMDTIQGLSLDDIAFFLAEFTNAIIAINITDSEVISDIAVALAARGDDKFNPMARVLMADMLQHPDVDVHTEGLWTRQWKDEIINLRAIRDEIDVLLAAETEAHILDALTQWRKLHVDKISILKVLTS